MRNRFTEIWVPSMEDMDDVLQIITSKLDQDLKQFGPSFIEFAEWFGKIYGAGDASSGIISLRDMLAWVGFANKLFSSIGTELSVLHGAAMVFIDSIGTNSSAALAETPEILKSRKLDCVKSCQSFCIKTLLQPTLRNSKSVFPTMRLWSVHLVTHVLENLLTFLSICKLPLLLQTQ